MTSSTLAGRPRTGAVTRVARQAAADTIYLLLGFPLATVSFVVIVTGLSVGFGTLFLLFGLPLIVLTLYAARGFAELERLRMRPVLRTPLPRPRYREVPPDASFLRRTFTPLVDGQYWVDLLHGLVVFGVSTATFVVAVTWWSTAVFGLAYVLYGWFVPAGANVGIVVNDEQLTAVLGMGDSAAARVVMYGAVGLFFLGTLPWVLRGMALFQAYVARLMLFVPFAVHRATPPALERPLPESLRWLTASAPVAIEFDTPLVGRLHPAIEHTAYSVVAEAVRNVVRHSGAQQCRVSVERLGHRLMVIVIDDGHGGAVVLGGQGLGDVDELVRATGGTLTVTSPVGGPTTVAAELPYA
jgi:hypothetical protein